MKNIQMKPCRRCRGSGKEIDQKALGVYMRKRRLKAKISLRDMGDRLGVSHAYIWDMETGRRAWSVYMRNRFLEEL